MKELIKPIYTLVHQLAERHFGNTRERFRDIDVKGLNQLVTDMDIQVEKELVDGLSNILPEAGFLTEEKTTEQRQSGSRWIIDPIDGTTNFIHGVPVYAISIGLEIDGEIVLGAVFELNRLEFFHAIHNEGAFLNDERIRVADHDKLEDTLIATGFPYYDFERTGKYLKALEQFMKRTRGVRRLGSAAMDLAYVACGMFDGFFEYSLSPWDVAGGSILVREAGGLVTDFKGDSDYIYGKEIIAAQPKIIHDFRSIIAGAFA